MSKTTLLFSGGYDSVAVLHKLIYSGDYNEINLIFEYADTISCEYELHNAKKIYEFFKNKHENIKLNWKQVNVNTHWVNDKMDGRDYLLFLHLSTYLRNSDTSTFYLGWNKSNIKELELSNTLLEWFNKNKQEEFQIRFLEHFFSGKNGYETKAKVIRYLLLNDLFGLPFTSSKQYTLDSFAKRKVWYENNNKETEVATALVETRIFNSLELSKIFKMKSSQEIQDFYNKYKRNDEDNNNQNKK